MNKRIRELAMQAGLSLEINHHDSSRWWAFGNNPEFEKFAELIVRECAEVLDKTISPPSHDMNSIGYKLKQHFGVVE